MPGSYNWEEHEQFLHRTIPISRRRWHTAFATVYAARALLSSTAVAPKPSVRDGERIPYHKGCMIIDIEEDSPDTDKETLAKITKHKDLKLLQNLGGVRAIASAIETDLRNGIRGDKMDIAERQQVYGTNTYDSPSSTEFHHFMWETFKETKTLVLLLCAALSLGFGLKLNGMKQGWYDGGSIFLGVFLDIFVSSLSNYAQSREFKKLISKHSENIKVHVTRNSQRQQISTRDVVVGDVIDLKIGDRVPADGIFIDGTSFQIDESSMIEESDDHVGIGQPFFISDTKIIDGYGHMMVTSVGMNTKLGDLMTSASHSINGRQTPLHTRLNKLTSLFRKLGLVVAVLNLIILVSRYFKGHTKEPNGKISAHYVLNGVFRSAANAIMLGIFPIPEGTVILAYSIKRMMADRVMVRKLFACEAMGSATIICTDKTGSLSQAPMKVTQFWLGYNLVEQGAASTIPSNVAALIRQGVALNTTGCVYKPCSRLDYEISGSPAEKAILSWAVSDLNMEIQQLKQSCKLLQVEAFNSQKKYSAVLIRSREDSKVYVHLKGAAEMVLEKCSHYYDAFGNSKPLDRYAKASFKQILQRMAANGVHCIAFAHKEALQEEHRQSTKTTAPKPWLTLLGIAGLSNPCKPELQKAIQDCWRAGVKVKMFSGDDVYTATAIATECGILQQCQDIDGAVIEGTKFRSYSEEERMEKVDEIQVLARSSPFDKRLMVQCLKKKGHVVAVMGNGTNDAPALKEADIGLSMRIQGTQAAKESSDIVILDDNFGSVTTVLRWSRCIHSNIQKFIQFHLTVNVTALMINTVTAASGSEVPITAAQLLWVNLTMDTLGALTLASEKPSKELMHKKPARKCDTLITNVMWRNVMAQALYQITVLLTLQFKGESIFRISSAVKNTMVFNTFVLCQVFNEFNARKLEKKNMFGGIHKNKPFFAIITITIVLQVVMVEFLKKLTHTERLNWGQWGACIGIAAASWPLGWLVKCIPVPEMTIFQLH